MISLISTMLHTIRYMKPVQVLYQLKNRIWKVESLKSYQYEGDLNSLPLTLIPDLRNINPVIMGNTFSFLNLSATFPQDIDWNYSNHGKLWNYNLQYLDFIHQNSISIERRTSWIEDIYSKLISGGLKPEPYPASLRAMNIIRFFSDNPTLLTNYPALQSNLYAELCYLNDHYEYHILGNHLLENAFGMVMGGYYFQKTDWKEKAEKILKEQLIEQILPDGAHFELSPMYHRIILFRVLEAISYTEMGSLNSFLRKKAEKMLGWLSNMSFSNQDIPHFNDSANEIALSLDQLNDLASSLNLETEKVKLFESGYRKMQSGNIELIADIHGISPSYQPGHAHSDHLSFELYSHGKPFIIDPGTSTYTISERRQWERSSLAHNTVTVNLKNQSEVWSGFRVGRRAKVRIVEDRLNLLKASVVYPGVVHTRTFNLGSSLLILEDVVKANETANVRFFLHPSVIIKDIKESEVHFESGEHIRFENGFGLKVWDYEFAAGFNKLEKSKFIELFFNDTCKSFISAG